jgi:hypothetical protein
VQTEWKAKEIHDYFAFPPHRKEHHANHGKTKKTRKKAKTSTHFLRMRKK